MVIGSTTAIIIGLTWGGVTHPWGSKDVLIPLVVGIAGMGVFFIYEANIPREPLVSVLLPILFINGVNSYNKVPWVILANRTSLSG